MTKRVRKVSESLSDVSNERMNYFIELYNNGMNLSEIGKKEGLSRERIRQIVSKSPKYKRRIKPGLTKEEKKEINIQKRIAEFWNRVEIKSSDECWNFQGCLCNGYGKFIFRSIKEEYAHRIAWIITNGPIPDEMFVCHHCDNPTCVNPKHLWLGTAKDNIIDRDIKGRGNCRRGEDHGGCKLTDAQVAEIRKRYGFRGKNGESTCELANEFEVSNATIWQIVNYKTRKNMPLTGLFELIPDKPKEAV